MEAMMNFSTLKSRIFKHIRVNKRLKIVCLWYLIFFMASVRKHSLNAAAQFLGLATSQFSRFLKNHADMAFYNLNQLSKKQARQFSATLDWLAAGQLPWKVAILIDSTIQHRSSLEEISFHHKFLNFTFQFLVSWPL
jgi:hypothetical protein